MNLSHIHVFDPIEGELETGTGVISLCLVTDALKERNLLRSGRNFELATRLISFATAVAKNQGLFIIGALGASDIVKLAADDEAAEEVSDGERMMEMNKNSFMLCAQRAKQNSLTGAEIWCT